MKTFQVFLGLTVLILVLWAAASPVSADGKSLIGGEFYVDGMCCESAIFSHCSTTWPMAYHTHCLDYSWQCDVRSYHTGKFCDNLGNAPSCRDQGLGGCYYADATCVLSP